MDYTSCFTVNLSAVNPDDPKWSGEVETAKDFATLAEALAAANDLDAHFNMAYYDSVGWIIIDGPGTWHVLSLKNNLKDIDYWAAERRIQAAMNGDY
jgi:hypothetical protein